MTKAITGDAFIPANRENPSLRPDAATRSKRLNPSCYMHVRHHGGAVKSSHGASAHTDLEYLKNAVNIDKFLKLFWSRTNDIYDFSIASYRHILK